MDSISSSMHHHPRHHPSQWPDLVILEVLSNFPLYDLICSTALVNSNWRRLSLELCAQQTVLRLLVGPVEQTSLKYAAECDEAFRPVPPPLETLNLTSLATLTEPLLQWLVTHMPRVSHLEVYSWSISTTPHMLNWISKALGSSCWSERLVRVELSLSMANQFGLFFQERTTAPMNDAFKNIMTVLRTRLSKLRHLKLITKVTPDYQQMTQEYYLQMPSELIPLNWPWLDHCHLSAFSSAFKRAFELFRSQNVLNTEQLPQSLTLPWLFAFPKMRSKSPVSVLERIQAIHIDDCFKVDQDWTDLSKFNSLTELSLPIDLSFLHSRSGLVRCLQSMPATSLRTLKLMIQLSKRTEPGNGGQQPNMQNESSLDWMPAFPWIRYLSLNLGFTVLSFSLDKARITHPELESVVRSDIGPALRAMFPNLTRSRVTVTECQCYAYHGVRGDSEQSVQSAVVRRSHCQDRVVDVLRPFVPSIRAEKYFVFYLTKNIVNNRTEFPLVVRFKL